MMPSYIKTLTRRSISGPRQNAQARSSACKPAIARTVSRILTPLAHAVAVRPQRRLALSPNTNGNQMFKSHCVRSNIFVHPSFIGLFSISTTRDQLRWG